MTCPEGLCIRGIIAASPVAEQDWDNAVSAFELMIENFNIRTRTHQVNHPGFVRKATYCCRCGRKLDDD